MKRKVQNYKKNQMEELILKYLTGNATKEEAELLEAWVKESKENHKYFLFRKNIYNITNSPFEASEIDDKKALKKVLSRTNRFIAVKFISKIAALLIFGVLLLTVVTVINEKPAVEVAQKETPVGKTKRKQAQLTLASGEKIILDKKTTKEIVDGGVKINLTAGKIEYEATTKSENVEKFNEIDVPRSGEFYIVLDDGTKVWMNADTKLKYPTKFLGKERKVYLEGEAYFEVTPDKKRPFRVISSSQEVVVLGTSFNICSYTDEKQGYVTLQNGKVEVESKLTGQKAILTPGKQAVINRLNGDMMMRVVDPMLYCGWKDGKLIFESNSLEDIFNRLARYYDLDIVWESENLKNIKFSGEIKKYNEIKDVLLIMEKTGDVRFSLEKNKIVVKK